MNGVGVPSLQPTPDCALSGTRVILDGAVPAHCGPHAQSAARIGGQHSTEYFICT